MTRRSLQKDDVIATKALPQRCPACASLALVVARSHYSGDRLVTPVACGRTDYHCGWSAKYEVTADAGRPLR